MRVQRPLIALHARPSVRPSVSPRPSGRLLDRPRRSYPAKAISCSHGTHVEHSGENRKGGTPMSRYACSHSSLFLLRSAINGPPSTSHYHSIFSPFYFSFGVDHGSLGHLATSCLHSPFAPSPSSSSSAKRIYLSRKTNVTILLVRVPDSGRGKEREEGEFWRQQRREGWVAL